VVFWLITIIRYVLAACAAFVLSLLVSFLIALSFAPEGDSPGTGFLWLMVFVGVATVLVPLGLGVTAELIQRKVLTRPFEWSKALLRSLASLPIAIGPLYAVTAVFPYGEGHRPAYWMEIETFLYGLSVFFAYLALRIRKPSVPAT
jgi:hypothetical protein